MVINPVHEYLFIEVPHTASTAISRELRELYGGEIVAHKHAKLSAARALPGVALDEYLVFGTVRDPVDTFVTHYYKFLTNHDGMYSDPLRYEDRGGGIPVDHRGRFEFVSARGDDFGAYLRRFARGVYCNFSLVGSDKFDRLMRFESIAEDFAVVLDALGIRMQRPLPLVNKTARPEGYAHLFDGDLKAFASDFFGPFMLDFGYALPEGWPAPRNRALLNYRIKKGLGSMALLHLGLEEGSALARWARRVYDGIS